MPKINNSTRQGWRFSFVRMDYGTRRDPDTGKIKRLLDGGCKVICSKKTFVNFGRQMRHRHTPQNGGQITIRETVAGFVTQPLPKLWSDPHSASTSP